MPGDRSDPSRDELYNAISSRISDVIDRIDRLERVVFNGEGGVVDRLARLEARVSILQRMVFALLSLSLTAIALLVQILLQLHG